MEAKASARYVRVSPQKARLVIDLIRGKKINVLPKKRPIVKEVKGEAKKEAVEPSAPVATETPTPTAPAA